VALVCAAAAVALLVVPAATEGTAKNKLDAFVVATNRGPIPACSSTPDCPPANYSWFFVYVSNANRLTNLNNMTTRATVPNGFAVSSVDETVNANGHDIFDATWTPPPDAFTRPWSGHWPSTVTCPETGPCNVVGSPAVVPGETTAVVYVRWLHGTGLDEPNGKYVFSFTIHGTLDGTPVDISAISPPIEMTA